MTENDESTTATPPAMTVATGRRTEPEYRALNPAYPRAWWMIAWSGDVKGTRAVPHKVLERDLVLWRDQSGVLHCQAAHCSHLGAHLGHGGEVVGNTLRCPFHGWCYDATGKVDRCPGPFTVREGVRQATYRIVERYGVVFLWNGAGEPDFDFPDILGEAGFAEEDVVFARHRWYVPFPAKWFVENDCDGMHFAVAHDTAEWGETLVESESDTVMRLRNVLHGRVPWLGWNNIRRRVLRGEPANLLTPVNSDILCTSWGGVLNLIRFAGRPGILGNMIACWTPIDANSHYTQEITLLPKVRVPVLGRAIERAAGFGLGLAAWTTLVQDAGLMMYRREPANPPYTSADKAMIAYRRFWDSRIVTDEPLSGDGVRNNGVRAGIRQKEKERHD
jgi:nitrite reductase/ring-hydroxylating ferredoxin subunit